MFLMQLLIFTAYDGIWMWFIVVIGVSLLYLHWKTTKFTIRISPIEISFWKKTFGIQLPKKSFIYSEIIIDSGDVLFKNSEEEMKVHFERKDIDTVEFELNSKFYPIGTETNAVEIMEGLRKLKTNANNTYT